jgi:hypothetical protein
VANLINLSQNGILLCTFLSVLYPARLSMADSSGIARTRNIKKGQFSYKMQNHFRIINSLKFSLVTKMYPHSLKNALRFKFFHE